MHRTLSSVEIQFYQKRLWVLLIECAKSHFHYPDTSNSFCSRSGDGFSIMVGGGQNGRSASFYFVCDAFAVSLQIKFTSNSLILNFIFLII